MATGNVDYSFPKRNLEFSRPFNLNFLHVELQSEFLGYSERTSSTMDNNVYADRPLTIQVLDNESLNYPIASTSDNGNIKDSDSSSKETKSVQSLSDFLAMNKNNPPSVVRQELMHSVIPEELTINVDVDEGSLHSWRPNMTNSLSADIFLPQPLFDISPTANLLTSSKNQDLNIPQLPLWNKPVQNELSDDMDKIQISVNPGFPKNFQIDIQGHMSSQKALLNTVKYEVMNARRNKTELKEAIDNLAYKLEERKMFQNSQDIKRLSEENARLRLECQCLCMEVDYYLKGQAPLGEVDENFYGENSSQFSQKETQGQIHDHCLVQSQTVDTDEQEESNEWECPKCTFANHPAIRFCEMCQLPRPQKENPLFLSSKSETCYCHPDKKPEPR
ncbi:uncharacterized protein LOC129964161 [Argiope bruennichi]|uniref:TGF-beta-activated kinase 1 and MAP3K7-binding like protein n=1 Tax=Argiope bruennichi TaxID=94029 RepID=A0A8T0EXU3_ARGBR|nr:uncharacterized protein LOC129964161 [Argiope bruennichi]KAF8782920.1 TGF-beta-activated kinase 1 and MAP3K7-binding like protein [Argiope bruennichi]